VPAHPFRQVDVFTTEPFAGNPVAVVHEADEIEPEQMQRVANWTNLSETTFLLRPSEARADYRVRIFTTATELSFAGHPTLGSAHAWLEAGGRPSQPDRIVQECGAGLVELRRTEIGLAFAAPPLVREGPVSQERLSHLVTVLGADPATVVDAQWVDNGPGWVALLLDSADTVLALEPKQVDHPVGVAGPLPPGAPERFEVRAFAPMAGGTVEDPVTGSLNASLAGWLIRTGRATAPYVARQGTALGRAGRVHVSSDGDGAIWVGGGTVTCIAGEVEL
jgi:PhzF family phenazine biosynthesis protein